MADLSDIIERLEKADGPDRLMDANILWAVDPEEFHLDAGDDQDHLKSTYCYARGGWTMNKADLLHLDMVGVPRFTYSLDAAVALVQRSLSGWVVEHIGQDYSSNPPMLRGMGWCVELTDGEYHSRGQSKSFAIAWLIAILRALQQKGSSNG